MVRDDISDWERQRRCASFYQTQLGSIQQGAIAAQGAVPIVFLVASQLARLCTLTSPEQWTLVMVAMAIWAVAMLSLFRSDELEANRVLVTYELEHARLFPENPPYRLTSFLLVRTYRHRAKTQAGS